MPAIVGSHHIRPGDTVGYRWSVGSHRFKDARTEVRRGMVADIVRRDGHTFYKILGASALVREDKIVMEEQS